MKPNYQTLMGIVSQGEAKERLAKDEEKFLDRARTAVVIIEEPVVTRPLDGSA